MVRKTKEDAEQTRLAILESAMQIFYEKGFARTTFDAIAKRIGLTKGAVYWHFRNKEDVIAALIKQKFLSRRPTSAPPKIETLEALRQVCIDKACAIEKDEEFKRFLFFIFFQMEWSENIMKNIRDRVKELWELPTKELGECLRFLQQKGEIKAKINVDDLTEILMNLWNGFMNGYIAGYKETCLSENVKKGFDAVMAAAKDGE